MSDRVLVTGASGFIGRHLAARLPSCVRASRGDIVSVEAARDLVGWVRPDVVYHLASRVDLSHDHAVAEDCARSNVLGTLHLLQALAEHPPRVLVYASTSDVYGDGPSPACEDQRERPNTPYAAAKLAGEHLCRAYEVGHGVPVAVARLSQVYGPGQRPERFVPSVCRALLWGEPIALGCADVARDFVYISDAVEGLIRCAGAPGETVNLGHEAALTLGFVAGRLREIVGCHEGLLLWGARPDRLGEVRRRVSSGLYARTFLGWRPTVSFDEGLRLTIESERGRP